MINSEEKYIGGRPILTKSEVETIRGSLKHQYKDGKYCVQFLNFLALNSNDMTSNYPKQFPNKDWIKPLEDALKIRCNYCGGCGHTATKCSTPYSIKAHMAAQGVGWEAGCLRGIMMDP